LIRYLLNNVDSLICLAPYWQNFFLENFKNKNVQIINNVIPKPVNGFNHGLTTGIPVVNFLFLGRIGHRKGIFDILNVINGKKELLKGRVRLFAGGDGETERLRSFIKDNNLEDIVEYVGWIQGDEKNRLLSKADVYILPSYSEGLPISILEAMSHKLPIISTPVGGIPEVVTNDINGKLVNPGSLSGIESAMLFFVNDRSKLNEFGKASYERIAPFFPDYVSAQLQSVYEKLLATT
jgi:glycosyltransferase involved in cell wall biosynthesis